MKRIAIVKWTSIDISIISLSLIEMLASITIISQLPYFSMFSNMIIVINYLFLLIVISKKKIVQDCFCFLEFLLSCYCTVIYKADCLLF